METIKFLKRMILIGCLIGISPFISSCAMNQTLPDNAKGYGGEGGGGGH
ncbi:Uncharacterised protein [Legionella sainthelensi]|nr:hypothetical protein [Legionella sainthelensi]VEB39229.1 Uncharacterised protein [Legionella sainthelensi]